MKNRRSYSAAYYEGSLLSQQYPGIRKEHQGRRALALVDSAASHTCIGSTFATPLDSESVNKSLQYNGRLSMRVGWIGLGRMGLPMATRLLDGGYSLSIWNRTKSKAEPLGKRGANIINELADLAGVDVLFTMGRHRRRRQRGLRRAQWCIWERPCGKVHNSRRLFEHLPPSANRIPVHVSSTGIAQGTRLLRPAPDQRAITDQV
jgi:hypothetical protein